MDQHQIDLAKRLGEDPAILFLGQSYLKLDQAFDPFLSHILEKYDVQLDSNNGSYNDLFKLQSINTEAFRNWTNSLSESISVPDSVKFISRFPWSHVYSSAIDGILPKAFRSNIRSIQPIFNPSLRITDPRSRTALHHVSSPFLGQL